MITSPTIAAAWQTVAHRNASVVRLTQFLRDDAALELASIFQGISGERVALANVDGAGRTFLARARCGDNCNPLFRLSALFVLMRRLGVPRERAMGVIRWLHDVADRLWPHDEDMQQLHLTLHIEKCPESILRQLAAHLRGGK